MKNRLVILIKKEQINIIIVLLTIAYSFMSPLSIFGNGNSGVDSSVFRTIAVQMQEGLIPYKDTFDHKGPLLYLINYLGTTISFNHGVWIFELIAIFFTLLFMYKICNLKGSKKSSIIALLISSFYLIKYYDNGNLVEEYAMPFISISLYYYLDYFLNNRINKKRLIIIGVCFSCVLLLRPNMIAVWVVFCFGALINAIKKNQKSEIKKYAKYMTIGMLNMIVPFLLWMILNESIKDFIKDYLLFNIMYSSKAKTTINNLISGLNIHIIISIVILSFEQKKQKIVNSCYIISVVLSIVFILLSGYRFNHYYMTLIPLFSYPTALLINKINQKNKKYFLIYLICILMFDIIGVSNLNYNIFKNKLFFKIQNNIISNINIKEEINDNKIVEIINKNTSKEDKISVYGNHNIIYLKSNRLPASKYSYQFPISEVDQNILKEYFHELKQSKPKWIVVYKEIDEEIKKFLINNNYYEYCANKSDNIYMYTNLEKKEIK